MIIVRDTRDKPDKHRNVDSYLTKAGHTLIRSKLYVGDVALLHDQTVAIDLKQDVLELIMDMHKEHDRFRAECQRAMDAGIQLWVVVQETLPEGRIDKWVSPVYHSTTKTHKKGDPVTKTDMAGFRKSLYTMQDRYGVKFRFCSRKQTGALIERVLKHECV